VVKPPVTPQGTDGVGSDEWEIQVQLEQHIPELLPINGKRALVYYSGIPKQCKNCLDIGHIAPDCKLKKADWLCYVARFLKTGKFTEQMIGTWLEALQKHHPDFNRKDPNDLRQQLDLTRQGVPKNDLRRQIGPSSSRDLRTYVGNETGLSRGRGRGRGNSQNYSKEALQAAGCDLNPAQGQERGRGRSNWNWNRGQRGQRGYRGYRGTRGQRGHRGSRGNRGQRGGHHYDDSYQHQEYQY